MNKKNKDDVFLITGPVGFVGFHLSYFFLSQGYKIIGIDALTTYYDVKLKLERNKILKGFDNYIFFKELLENKESLKKIIYKYKPTIVIHLAAQAGVRYSIENPSEYVQSNLLGFCNLIEECKINKISHFIYASSSSVYGGNKNLPFKESDNVDHPISFYAATKKCNELMTVEMIEEKFTKMVEE